MSKWWQPSTSSQIKPIPWLAPEAIQYLENIIRPDFDVIEHGSGGSTLWFAERVKSVVAYEEEPDWQAIVKKKAPSNAKVMSGFPHSDRKFDLLLIDGEPVDTRAEWIQWAFFLVKAGGWIVLDNANRKEYAAEREMLNAKADLMYTTPLVCEHLVTEFYRVKPCE